MELLKELSPQVATLVVLYLVVRAFLIHNKENMELVQKMNDENIEARAHSRAVIEKNTAVVAENTEVCREMTTSLRETMMHCAAAQIHPHQPK
jgi:hypothetical protein